MGDCRDRLRWKMQDVRQRKLLDLDDNRLLLKIPDFSAAA